MRKTNSDLTLVSTDVVIKILINLILSILSNMANVSQEYDKQRMEFSFGKKFELKDK